MALTALTETGAGTGASKAPSCFERRRASFDAEQRMVFGATTFRQFVEMLASSTEKSARARPVGHPDDKHASHGGVVHAEKPS